MQIEITQQDIDSGMQNSSRECAIAQALIKAFGTRDVRVHHDHGIMVGPFQFAATREIHDFVRAFDNSKASVRPTMLTLSPIQQADLRHMAYNPYGSTTNIHHDMYQTHQYAMKPMYMDVGKVPMPMMMSTKEAKSIYGSFGTA